MSECIERRLPQSREISPQDQVHEPLALEQVNRT
jgi:hypothetical protein